MNNPNSTPKVTCTDDKVLTPTSILPSGGAFDLALATDENGSRYVVRSIKVEDGWEPAAKRSVATFRRVEHEAANALHASEDRGEFMQDAELIAQGQRHDVLVHPFIEGMTLERWIHANHIKGTDVATGLRIARQIASQLDALHRQKLIHRLPTPEHIIIDNAGNAHLIGFGNIARRAERPPLWQLDGDSRYLAPEIARERSGALIHPRADIFAFGGTLSYIFSGEHPTESPEAPISNIAWGRLMELPEGIRLLIAHCVQPFHKSRLINASKLLPFLESEAALPTRQTDKFGAIALLAPWSGALEPVRSEISAGPLVVRSDGRVPLGPNTADDAQAQFAPPHPEGNSKRPSAQQTDSSALGDGWIEKDLKSPEDDEPADSEYASGDWLVKPSTPAALSRVALWLLAIAALVGAALRLFG